ncbi:PREDICTED: NHL repeat-containing protein 2 [Ceratosolen solmsi marchali]|uniref:NHL repeat-containing protein 2 n=1 Tax=Ceratosolen solmsi marchali TaxID=326594 RepID=A0AAJ6YHA0_9HYME|nr:PREDICTED: NHL repeat-containing protein 2 [Ceratosolen solmsi marchali]
MPCSSINSVILIRNLAFVSAFKVKNLSLATSLRRNLHKSPKTYYFHDPIDGFKNSCTKFMKMSVQSTVEDLTQICIELRSVVESTEDESEKEQIVLKHIKAYAESGLRVNDFERGLEWFNVLESLSLYKHLDNKIVILDFFTYCCINCMHILPDLDALEKRFSVQDGLVVIGVHSAKFVNERDSSKIMSAVQRYNIGHPVVNDAKLSMWRDIGIVCWPSLVMLGPKGQPLFVLVGEGHKEELFLYTKVALKYFMSLKQISKEIIPLKLAQHILPMHKGSLLFPGKIHTFQDEFGEKLVISDTGNNRILVMEKDGKVEHVIGGYSPGFQNGDFETARFNAPQGVCAFNNNIFVADNENHAIRQINLEEKMVTTIAGTGHQGRDYIGGKIGKEQELSSPWDVSIYEHDQDGIIVPVLLIAIAGTHQIWALFLEDTIWWKKKQYKAGTCASIIGNGREANRNNSYPHAASLAQPSGLAVAQELKSVFFADSESSTIRKVCLDDGKVLPVCGADNNPTNLHSFGDQDGQKYSAKLQHPLGIAWNSFDKMIYIADTYNHKIKKTDVEGNCVTLCGRKKPSKMNTVSSFSMKSLLKVMKNTNESLVENITFQFDEPSGLALNKNGNVLYVTDTNNHCIKAIDLSNVQNICEIPVVLPAKAWNRGENTYNFTSKISTNSANLSISFHPVFSDDLKLNTEAPQRWSLKLPSSDWETSESSGNLLTPLSIKIPLGTEQKQIHIMLNIMTCKITECIPKNLSIVYTIIRDSDAPTNVIEKRELNIR